MSDVPPPTPKAANAALTATRTDLLKARTDLLNALATTVYVLTLTTFAAAVPAVIWVWRWAF